MGAQGISGVVVDKGVTRVLMAVCSTIRFHFVYLQLGTLRLVRRLVQTLYAPVHKLKLHLDCWPSFVVH